MEECCTCIKCGGQYWTIFQHSIVCMTCQIKISFEHSIVMSELVRVVNGEEVMNRLRIGKEGVIIM